ncbi:hypothetical protein HK405_005831 [Cladochytrium tenue]|nr:hypothetical protein HK405_005831 [Cladochytrium tenue]
MSSDSLAVPAAIAAAAVDQQHHRAVVLEAFGVPPTVRVVPTPSPAPGQVLVRVRAAAVLSYQAAVLSGARGNPLSLPTVPGCGAVGEVAATCSTDAACGLRVGDLVFVDPSLRRRDDASGRVVNLSGHYHQDVAAAARDASWRDGSWAEMMLVPVENAIPVPAETAAAAALSPAKLTLIGLYGVPYGGWQAAGLRAGQTVVVAYASGRFGRGAVSLALAMGAGRVVAVGRRMTTLQPALDTLGLSAADRARVVPCVVEGGNAAAVTAALSAAAGPGGVDVFLDLSPQGATQEASALFSAAVAVLKPRGSLVLMGGIRAPVSLPYQPIMMKDLVVRGQFMCTREAVHEVVKLVASGRLLLDDGWEVQEFGLDAFAEAVEFAGTAPSSVTAVLVPN